MATKGCKSHANHIDHASNFIGTLHNIATELGNVAPATSQFSMIKIIKFQTCSLPGSLKKTSTLSRGSFRVFVSRNREPWGFRLSLPTLPSTSDINPISPRQRRNVSNDAGLPGWFTRSFPRATSAAV